jgi:hypothetical protein
LPAMLMSNRHVCAPWRDWKECYGAGMVLPIDQHDALRMLAGSPGGCTESILLAHGFGIGTVHDLVDNGFATAERRTVRAERRLIGVTWLTITDAGRLALTE